jgi:hypothetical protein
MQGLNIQKNYGKYNKVPLCNTIKKILVGKLVSYHCSGNPLVILAVRRNQLYGNVQMLLGQYNGYSISVSSWYNYTGRNSIMFVGRDNRLSIRKCLKLNPKYIQYHLGKSIDLTNVQLYTRPREYKANALLVYDNCNYYKDYLESL